MVNHTISTQRRMKYYVYQLRAISSEIPFYIGKGSGGRSKSHFAQAQNGDVSFPQYREIQNYWKDGIAVVDEILFYTSDEQLAYTVERAYIESYSGRIVNQRQKASDYHPKTIKMPVFEYPRILSRAPFPFHYVRHWRNKYKLHSTHEDVALRLGTLIHADRAKLITDNDCLFFKELSFE